MRTARAAAVPVLGFVALVLCGCTAVPGGPARWGSDGTDADVLCSSVDPHEPMVVADVVTAPAGSAIELVSVDPVEPRNLQIDDILVSRLEADSGAVGNSSLPPTDELTMQIWNAREPVEGFELHAGGRANVLVVAERTNSERGSLDNLRLRYRIDGVVYEKTASTQYFFEDLCPGG